MNDGMDSSASLNTHIEKENMYMEEKVSIY